MGEQPRSRPDSGGKRIPMALPKAPQGEEVAQRLMKNASYIPVKRFDSADYFLQQWEAKQEQQRLQEQEQQHSRPEDIIDIEPTKTTSVVSEQHAEPPPAPTSLSRVVGLSHQPLHR